MLRVVSGTSLTRYRLDAMESVAASREVFVSEAVRLLRGMVTKGGDRRRRQKRRVRRWRGPRLFTGLPLISSEASSIAHRRRVPVTKSPLFEPLLPSGLVRRLVSPRWLSGRALRRGLHRLKLWQLRACGFCRGLLPSLPKRVRASLVGRHSVSLARRVRKSVRLKLNNIAPRGFGRVVPRYYTRRGRVSTTVHLLKSSKYSALWSSVYAR